MSAKAPVAGLSLCVLERSIVFRGSCWIGSAVGAALGGAVGLAGARLGCGVVVLWVVGAGSVGRVYGWNRGVMGWMIIGTSVGLGWTARLDCGALLGVRRGRLCVTTAGGGVRLFGGDGVGAGCAGVLGTALAGARLFFGVLCSSRITAVLTSAIKWAPFHSVACIFLILFGFRMAVLRVGACVYVYDCGVV